MKFITSFTAFSLLASSISVHGQGDETNIVGGVPAAPGAYPWYSAGNFFSASCGGSLIGADWVMTAAHCTFYQTGEQIRIGVENLYTFNSGVRRTIGQVITHPDYDASTNANDIMLLRLVTPVTDVEPLAYEVSPSTSVPADGEKVTVMGFGTVAYQAFTSDVILQTEVEVINFETCNEAYAGYVFDSVMVCAGVEEGGKDSCQGDSGGPLITSKSQVAVGIVSWGFGCAFAEYPGVYSRVGAFSSWIKSITGIDGVDSTAKPKLFSRRRMLSAPTARSLEQQDSDYQKYIVECGHLDYNVALYVDPDTHLYLVGELVDKKAVASANCPKLGAVHAVMSYQDQATKEILLWEDESQGASMFEKDDMMSVGTFKLSDMARAYENAEPANTFSRNNYDLITNNCGSFLVNLAKEMGVKVNARMMSFVARRLLENSGQQLIDKIRGSRFYHSLVLGSGNRNLRSESEASERELVNLLVEKTVGAS